MTKAKLDLYNRVKDDVEFIEEREGVLEGIAELADHGFTKEEIEELGYRKDYIELAWDIHCLDEDDE